MSPAPSRSSGESSWGPRRSWRHVSEHEKEMFWNTTHLAATTIRIASRVVWMYPTDGRIVESVFCLGLSRVAAMGLEYDS